MNLLKYGPVQSVFAIFMIIIMFPHALIACLVQAEKNCEYQNSHMEYLRSEYYSSSYKPCDENKIASFDIQKAISDGVKFNEVAFLGTHNSYQTKATDEYTKLYNYIDILTFGAVKGEKSSFSMDTLTQQLELGIRNLEIDIETVVKEKNISFIVSHDPLLDNSSSCYDFETALEEIKLWSDANPNHLPVSIIIEPKENLIPVNGLKNFNLEYSEYLDEIIRKKLGDTLLTPAEMTEGFSSFKEMRENDGWLPLEKTLGRVLVLLHDTEVTDEYISRDVSIKSQAMFPMLSFDDRDESYTSFILCNKTNTAIENKAEAIDRCNLIVRTRADKYLEFSDERYERTDICGSQIISTDYPFRAGENKNHVYSFDGYTVKLLK